MYFTLIVSLFFQYLIPQTNKYILTLTILQSIFNVAIKIILLNGMSSMSSSSRLSNGTQTHFVLLTNSFSPGELYHFLPSWYSHLAGCICCSLTIVAPHSLDYSFSLWLFSCAISKPIFPSARTTYIFLLKRHIKFPDAWSLVSYYHTEYAILAAS